MRSLCVDYENNVWIGGDCGISCYSYKTGYFQNYKIFNADKRENVVSIIVDTKKRIWALTSSGQMFYYNQKNDRFKKINFKPLLPENTTAEQIVDKGEYLFVCTSYGLYKMDKNSYRMEYIDFCGKKIQVHDVIMYDNDLWIATSEDGVYVVDEKNVIKTHYKNIPGNSESLLNNKVRALTVDKDGNVWFGTFKGLSVLKPETKEFDNYQSDSNKRFSLSNNSIRSIYLDSDGGVWIGTFYGGVSYYHHDNIKFRTIDMHNGSISLNDNIVNCISGTSDGFVWFGTNDNGLNRWNIKDNSISYYSLPTIKSLLPMDDGSVLVGTHWEGLIHFFPSQNIRKIYKHTDSEYSISDNRVDALLKDSKGDIWVGTYKGLLKFDLKSGRFTLFNGDSNKNKLSSDGILSLYEDSKHRLWIGTFNGLNMYDLYNDRLEVFKFNNGENSSFSSNEITCVLEDKKKRIWIGTSNGFYSFNQGAGTFKRYSFPEEWGFNSVSAVLEDKNGYLWISANNGLIKFSPDTNEMQHFTVEDGLPSNQFNHSSACKLSDGRIMFGSLNGVTIFDPDNIKYSYLNDHTLYTDIWVNDKHIRCNDGTGILNEHPIMTKNIILQHNQNVFTVKFSTINYRINNKLAYQYSLKGNSDKWRDISGNKITLYDLHPSEYTLCVKVAPLYSSGGRSPVSKLNIKVLSPWWESSYMIVLYILTAILISVLIIRVIKSRIRMNNELRVEKMNKKKMEELQTQQMQFFVNISHEFKTPLTLIISPLEKLMETVRNNEWERRQLDIVYNNAKLLMSLIDKLIHFRKAENGQIKLHASKANIISSLSSIYMSFFNYAKGKNINYIFDTSVKEFDMFYDKDILERICFNFLSNAFKFTPSGGSITLKAEKREEYFVISVKDTGKGIPKEQHKLIFERFYSGTDNESVGGTGIGLTYAKLLAERHHGRIELKSEVGSGSEFSLLLPISRLSFSDDEIVDDENNKTFFQPYLEDTVTDVDAINAQSDDTAENEKPELLVVDDNVNMTNFLKDNLSHDYKVTVAHDGQEALDLVTNNDYELVICDVMMPKINGIVLCKKIKQNIKTSHIPIILLSAKADVEHQIEGLEVGADDYLPKPFSMKLLESKIKNVIMMRKRMEEMIGDRETTKSDNVAFYSVDQELLDKAASIVETHMSDPDFSVEMLAEEMCMSHSNLHLKFKAITGESVSDFIRKIRFNKAVSLLEEGRYNIAEISTMTGFSTPSYLVMYCKGVVCISRYARYKID